MPAALFDDHDIAALREALQPFTGHAVDERIGAAGRTALSRTDFAGVSRELRGADPLDTFIRLFAIGAETTEEAARAAFRPLPLEHAVGAGLLAVSAGSVRAELAIVPYGQDDPRGNWWLVSDMPLAMRPGAVRSDHVLGANASAANLANATPRRPVGRALDIGTGCGLQALHLGMHSDAVVATDVNERALRCAATTAALSGVKWDLRQGSFLEPVAGETFDLVVSNPPFVISPGRPGPVYRDSGMAGDAVSAMLARGIPGLLAPGGVGQLLANWIVPTDQAWEQRLADWFHGTGCDVWVWQREQVELAEYVTMWLIDGGEQPGSARWSERYHAWLDWFATQDIAAIGMGTITMWRTDADETEIVVQDVRQAVEQPIGNTLPDWHARQRWLARVTDGELLETRLSATPGLVRERLEVLDEGEWRTTGNRLRQTLAMRWQAEIDDSISALIAGCDGKAPLAVVVSVLAAALGMPADDAAAGVLPTVRELVSRGFLIPHVQL